jgi:predicted nucleic acid-binding protein
MAVFDSAVLTLLLWDQAKPPQDPTTGKPVERCKERMELLVEVLHKTKQTILIPTPVISEVLTVSSASLRYIAILQKTAVFRIEPFDTRAAIELAEMNKVFLAAGDKKAGIDAPWQKIKIDRQIISVARVAGAKTLYTNDGSLRATAESVGFKVIGVHELPLPVKQDDSQHNFLEMLDREAAAMNGIDDAKETAPPEEDESGA